MSYRNDFFSGELNKEEGFPNKEAIGILPPELEAYNAKNRERNFGVVIVRRGEKFTAYVRHYTQKMSNIYDSSGIYDKDKSSYWCPYTDKELGDIRGKKPYSKVIKVALKIAERAEVAHLKAIEWAEFEVDQFADEIRRYHNKVYFTFTEEELAAYNARVATSKERLAILTDRRDGWTN